MFYMNNAIRLSPSNFSLYPSLISPTQTVLCAWTELEYHNSWVGESDQMARYLNRLFISSFELIRFNFKSNWESLNSSIFKSNGDKRSHLLILYPWSRLRLNMMEYFDGPCCICMCLEFFYFLFFLLAFVYRHFSRIFFFSASRDILDVREPNESHMAYFL